MTLLDAIDRLATTRTIERSAGHLYTLRDAEGVHGPWPGMSAITTLQDASGGADGLATWALSVGLDAYIAAATDPGRNLEEARQAAFDAKNQPRETGNAVHLACHRFNEGLNLELTDVTAPYVAHYAAALHREGIDVLASERYTVNASIGFGGTYDSLVRVGKEVGCLDLKTGKEKVSMRLQLTGLSMAEYHGAAGLEAEPMPALDSVGWILLLRRDGYQLVRHDITDADRDHFIRLVHTYHAIREWSADR
jgi:hypothetical protein